MRWPFRGRGTAQAEGDGPGHEAVRPSGQWRELTTATSVLPLQPTADSSRFVRTLPSRWQQSAVLAPLGHDVTADAPGGLVAGLAVGVAPPAGAGSPVGVAGRRPAIPADEVVTERPVTGMARVARGLPGVSLLRRARPGRASGGSLLESGRLDQGHGAMPGSGQPAEPQPRAPYPADAQLAGPQPPVSPGVPQQRGAVSAARPIGPTASIRVLGSGAATPAARPPETGPAASTPTGEAAATQPSSRRFAAARDADPRAFPSRADTVARAAPGAAERPAALVRPAGSVPPAAPGPSATRAEPAGSVPPAARAAPAGSVDSAVPVAPAGSVPPATPVASAEGARARSGTGIGLAGPDASARSARPDAGPLAVGPRTEESSGAAGARFGQRRSGGTVSGFGSAQAAGSGSGPAEEPAGSSGSQSGRLRRRPRLGPPLTGLAAERAAGLGGAPPAPPSAQAASVAPGLAAGPTAGRAAGLGGALPARPSAQAASVAAGVASVDPPVSLGARLDGPAGAGPAVTSARERTFGRDPRATALVRAAEIVGLPVVTPLLPAGTGPGPGRPAAPREFAPLTPMRPPIGSRAWMASRFGAPASIETGGPGPGPAAPGTATMLAAGLAPGPPSRSSAALPTSADTDPAGGASASAVPVGWAAGAGIPSGGGPGSMAGGGAAGDHLVTMPLAGTRRQGGAESRDASRQSIGRGGPIVPGRTQRAVPPVANRSWPQAGLAGSGPDGGIGSSAPAGFPPSAGGDSPWPPPGRPGDGPGAPRSAPAPGPMPGGAGGARYQPGPSAASGFPASPFPAAGPATDAPGVAGAGAGAAGPASAGPASAGLASAGPASAGPSAAGSSAADTTDPASLDRLAQRLYGRLRGHLAAELLADREHAQLLTDL
jgi:hypothetical protein